MRLVIDTSIFVNPVTRNEFGTDIALAIERFISIIKANGIELFIPSSIYRELSNFASETSMISLRRVAVIRGPDLLSMQVPAAILHSFIGDIRERINRGLRIAEGAIHSSKTPESIRRIRNEYRGAMRSGIVDSVEDLDVVLLAREIGGTVLSADEGIFKMADSLGIEVFSAVDFINKFSAEQYHEDG